MEEKSLKAQYLLSIYEELASLSDNECEKTSLVKHIQTGKIAVKKIVAREKLEIYERLQKVVHPNLVPIYEVADCGEYGLVIESYISGNTLEEEILASGKLAEEKAISYIRQLTEVLELIHQNGIIHRDINPKNILISVDGVLKLIDFGIARQPQQDKSQDTTILGTVGYAAPEQFGFRQTDARTDIYAVGVLFNVMLTGRLPNEVRYEAMPYGKIIEKATQIDPEKRYQTVEELMCELKKQREKKDTGRNSADTSEQLLNSKILPGYRTGVRWKKVVAAIGYGLMLFYSVLSMVECAKTPLSFILETVAILIYIWIAFLAAAGFLKWDQRIWPVRKFPREVRIAVRVVAWTFIFYMGYMIEDYVRYTMLGMIRA